MATNILRIEEDSTVLQMINSEYFAERVGFEPTVPRKRDTGFRDRLFQPLRHLSEKLLTNIFNFA